MVNKAIIVGNLGRDPEVRFTPSGRAVAKFSVATTETLDRSAGPASRRRPSGTTSSSGASRPRPAASTSSKGRQVYVEGRITNRSYDDKDGNKRYITEIIARDVRFLGGGGQGRSSDSGFVPPPGEEDAGPPGPSDDDIPF